MRSAKVTSKSRKDLHRDLDGEADVVIRSCRAPGTIRTSAEQVSISRNSKRRLLRRERESRAAFRRFNFCPGHVGEG
jgi:hypothetical protein